MQRSPLPFRTAARHVLRTTTSAAALLIGAWGPPAGAQPAPAAPADGPPAAVAPARPPGLASAAAPSSPRPGRGIAGGPPWTALTAPQRAALAPLAPHWDGLTEAHKRKWMAMTRDFPDLSGPEQERLHSRMASWAALSPRERAQARFNFASAQERLSSGTRKELWENYQALSSDEKHRLAASAPPTPAKGAATLAHTPAAAPAPVRLPHAPARAAAEPPTASPAPAARTRIQHNTLLPERAFPAPAPRAATVPSSPAP